MVAGGTGYIGRAVVKELVSRGYKTTVLAREKSGIGGAEGKAETRTDEASERARKAKAEADAARKAQAAADSAAAQQKIIDSMGSNLLGSVGKSLGAISCGASQGSATASGIASGAYPPPKDVAKIATVGSENSLPKLPGPGRGAGPNAGPPSHGPR